jgi:hypothetical protein
MVQRGFPSRRPAGVSAVPVVWVSEERWGEASRLSPDPDPTLFYNPQMPFDRLIANDLN